MSHEATRWAWEQGISPTEKLVLLILADRANSAGECWPSIASVRADTGLDRKTLYRSVRQLEACGLISVLRRFGAGHRYRLNLSQKRDRSQKRDQCANRADTGPKNGTDTGPKNGTGPVPKTGHGTYKEPINESVKNPARFALPDWIPESPWKAFVKMRKQTPAGITDEAKELLVKKLADLRASGEDVGAVLDQSVRNGYRDVFPVGKRNAGRRQDFADQDYTAGAR